MLSEMARNHIEKALPTLVEVAANGSKDSAPFAAAGAILDRGYGRATQTKETDQSGQSIDDEILSIGKAVGKRVDIQQAPVDAGAAVHPTDNSSIRPEVLPDGFEPVSPRAVWLSLMPRREHATRRERRRGVP